MTFLSRIIVITCIGLLSTSVSLTQTVNAQEAATASKASDKKTRKVPTLRGRVYEQLSRAQAFADNDQPDEAFAVLKEVEGKKSSMNSYEIAMLYNFYAFIHYGLEDADKALEYFKKVVAQTPIPESFEQSTVFTLAQLSLMQGDYKASIDYLQRWETLNRSKIPPKHFFIKAQAYYQDKQFEQAAQFIEQAVSEKEAAGMLPDEGWLILQRAIYYELKEPRKVKDVIVKLVKLYDEPKYWIQLGGMYGELEMEKHQLAIMEAAYQQGYLTKGGDLFNMAQLYYYHKAPIKCANVMQSAMDDGLLDENLRNLKFLGQCLQLAKENEKAIPVMRAAADLSPDGELYAQLSQLFLNIDRFDDAIATAELALEKGDLRNQGTVHLVLGMSYYNQRQFVKALDQLAEAEEFKNTRAMARQWQQFVSGEKRTYEAIRADLDTE